MSSFPKKNQSIAKKLLKVAVQSEFPEKIFMIECDVPDLQFFISQIRPRIPNALTIGSMYWKGGSFFHSYSKSFSILFLLKIVIFFRLTNCRQQR